MKRVLICLVLLLAVAVRAGADWKDLGRVEIASGTYKAFKASERYYTSRLFIPQTAVLGGIVAAEVSIISEDYVTATRFELVGCGRNYIEVLKTHGQVKPSLLHYVDKDSLQNQITLTLNIQNPKETRLKYSFPVGKRSRLLFDDLPGIQITILPFEGKSGFFLDGSLQVD